jgi:hypothetical protein
VCAEYASALAGVGSALAYIRAWELDDEEATADTDAADAARVAFVAGLDDISAEVLDVLDLSDAQVGALAGLLRARAAEAARALRTRERRAATQLCGSCAGGTRRVLRNFCTWELQSQLWNVVAAFIYVAAAFVGVCIHFSGAPLALAPLAEDAHVTPRLVRIDALRYSSQGYVIGDVLFFLDALIAFGAWRASRSKRFAALAAAEAAASSPHPISGLALARPRFTVDPARTPTASLPPARSPARSGAVREELLALLHDEIK